ncbi:hypothetical protein WA588_003738, partial [Blastocystis sp. NMH]
MGVVDNFESIRSKTVVVVGIGGIGSVASEMLVRCGIGKLILFDYDVVEAANMNRLFYRPSQQGSSKVDAAKDTLNSINPDVSIEAHNADITQVDAYPLFTSSVQEGGLRGERVDLVLSCVDNYGARITVNSICTRLNQPWMESGVSEDAVSGHIQFMLPGRTACFQCLPPLAVAAGMDERTIKRNGVCTASLPTTMSIIAGFLVHNVLKYLLHFGQIAYYQGYLSQTNYFPSCVYYPNPECVNADCRRLQEEFKGKWKPDVWKPKAEEKAVEEENEWGITVEESGCEGECKEECEGECKEECKEERKEGEECEKRKEGEECEKCKEGEESEGGCEKECNGECKENCKEESKESEGGYEKECVEEDKEGDGECKEEREEECKEDNNDCQECDGNDCEGEEENVCLIATRRYQEATRRYQKATKRYEAITREYQEKTNRYDSITREYQEQTNQYDSLTKHRDTNHPISFHQYPTNPDDHPTTQSPSPNTYPNDTTLA